jgi:hypothetical protein
VCGKAAAACSGGACIAALQGSEDSAEAALGACLASTCGNVCQ